MKGKISLIWRVVIALVLASSLGMAMAVPAAAAPDLSAVTITVTPTLISHAAKYQIDFYIHTGLTNDYNCFVMEFPTGTTVPGTILPANVEIYDMDGAAAPQVPSSVVIAPPTKPGMVKLVRVYMPGIVGGGIMAFHHGRVVFLDTAGIKNPSTKGTYGAWVYTDEEPNPVYDEYEIKATVPVDVFLKYVYPVAKCGYLEEIPVGTFLLINEALKFVDDLHSKPAAEFDLTGADTDNAYGTMTGGSWSDGSTIGDTLWFKNITYSETETFTVTYNKNDGTPVTSAAIPIPSAADINTGLTGVVDVVSVVGTDDGIVDGYQNTFNLTGNLYNTAAGAYGNFGKTTAGAFTDGTSIGEALSVNVTTAAPGIYEVTYIGDDATSGNTATLAILNDGTPLWVPVSASPANVVDITGVTAMDGTPPAWDLYTQYPPDGGIIGAKVLVRDGTYTETFEIDTPGVEMVSENGAASTIIDATGLAPANASAPAAVYISAGGVTFNGFTVKNAGSGVAVGSWPNLDKDLAPDINGILVSMTSEKNDETDIMGAPANANYARVNILNNIVYGSTANGIQAGLEVATKEYVGACVLVTGNNVHDNQFNGFCGVYLYEGYETCDPEAFTK